MVTNNKHTAPKEDDAISTIMVLPVDNALNPAHDREIDIQQIDEEDMKLLQQNDPFMYYSIPGVLQASVRNNDVAYSDIASLGHNDSHPSSSPQQSQEQGEDDACKVSRRTRFSFECHPDVLLADLEQEMGDLPLDSKLDDMLSILFGGTNSRQ